MPTLKCGLLGRKLGHSRSPELHRLLGDYEYLLYEKEERDLPDFFHHGDWNALNVTVPYKKTVLPFLDELSPVAARIGSVNTIVRRADGTLYGDSTDVYGFAKLVEFSGFSMAGEHVMVLGSGGASAAVQEVLRGLKAYPVVISRSGPDNYRNLDLHRDCTYLVNATPVGMYPDTDAMPLEPGRLPGCLGVLDLIYNPPVTKLMRRADALNIPSFNGLYMLVAQAKKSSELFTGSEIPDSRIREIYLQMNTPE